MIQQEIPDWLKQAEIYVPQKDNNAFLKKTQQGLLAILGKMKMQSEFVGSNLPSPAIALFVLFEVILLTVLSKNLNYGFIELVVLLVYMATFPAKMIQKMAIEVLFGIVFAFLFSVPSYVMGNHYTMKILVLKTAITVCSVAIFTHRIPLHRLSQSIKKTPLSDSIRFIFDITMKYLVVLGRICMQMMDALKLRSIGQNPKKQSSAAGILGITYLKSQKMSNEMYQAMVCRGFDGTYQTYQKHRFGKRDILLILVGIAWMFLFIILH